MKLKETFARDYDERKIRVISQVFHNDEGNSRAVHRIFRKKLGNDSAKASPYGSAKAVISLRSAQTIFIHQHSPAKVSKDVMPQVNKSALVPFSAEQMYTLVDDVPSYKEFLPWCGGSEEVSREEGVVVASVTISKGSINKTFTTKNTSNDVQKIHMELVKGPFKQLVGDWHFKELKEGACKVTLELDYEFSNRLLGIAVGPVFNQIANAMVDSFVERAKVVYGN